ncbi:hypothetical protein FH972_026559 [Carpinus fangiana]|uniref:CoA-binding domain-containing protein n=1 Tax=Carpinus fangiana TaxID=176857 RepID=A0A5N6L4Q2_9ROSI|nr:hypothetical protein FH972_026559 [Carpinus fangiana]
MLSRTTLPRQLVCRLPHRSPSNRPLSSTSNRHASPYDQTIPNLKIGKTTRVIYQGFTGRVSTTNAQQSLEYGTNIVGGTTPGKEGEHLGLPLLPSVRKAAEQLKPDATAVFVAAQHAAGAIEDAIEAEIPLIVSIAEFIPLHDILRISSILKTQSKSRLVGANSPGIIAPLGTCRIGFQPLTCYLPGHVGIIAKSGTLSYETVGALTRAGIGQSLCIGMGGDIVAGTNMVEALQLFENDDDTHVILLAGEVGGRAEQDAAEWIKDYWKRVSNPKPVVAAVGGVHAVPGRIMGHAGAFVNLGEDPSEVKIKALESAGVITVDHPTKFVDAIQRVYKQAGKDVSTLKWNGQSRRSYHTSSRRIRGPSNMIQKRGLHIENGQAKKLLSDKGIPVSETEKKEADQRFLAITVDRSERRPAIIASPTTASGKVFARAKSFPYDYNNGPDQATVKAVLEQLHMDAAPPAAMATTGKLLQTLVQIFKEKEAYALSTHISGTQDGSVVVEKASFSFDDSAFKSGKRQGDIFALRDKSKEDADEVEAEQDGIVYVKLADPTANIGTLINGAGLAMNANDALVAYGAKPTNFLDTGGKATSATVEKAFELILRDQRVKVIFVNIFGGLTLCDMIADGIMLAFKNLNMKIPVVVRLRGTNEEKGQKMISESGLPLHAFDSFEDAAKKCIELAG